MKLAPIAPCKRIILAADVSSMRDLDVLLEGLVAYVGGFKVGLQMIHSVATGSVKAISRIRATGASVMLDGKLHDIPKTMELATHEIALQDVQFFTVHASAGIAGMAAAAKAKGHAKMLAVTVLTSMDDDACEATYQGRPTETVMRLATHALEAGADGLVCSPQELVMLRRDQRFKNMILVTPGVRPAGMDVGDQKRVMTPREAICAGADYLVIGRPITHPPRGMDSVEAARAIAVEIEVGLNIRAGAQ